MTDDYNSVPFEPVGSIPCGKMVKNLESIHPSPWRNVYGIVLESGQAATVLDANGTIVLSNIPRIVADSITIEHNAAWVQKVTGWTLYRDGGGCWIACESISKDGTYNGPIIKSTEGNECWYTGLRDTPAEALWQAWLWKEGQKAKGGDAS